jgi:hypothetical protein
MCPSQRADGVDTTEDLVVVIVIGDVVALDQCTQYMGAQVGGIPLLIFEFAWLVTSTRVDEILKARRRIKRCGHRLC